MKSASLPASRLPMRSLQPQGPGAAEGGQGEGLGRVDGRVRLQAQGLVDPLPLRPGAGPGPPGAGPGSAGRPSAVWRRCRPWPSRAHRSRLGPAPTSVPRPTVRPSSSHRRRGMMPLLRKALERGQWTMAAPAARIARRSAGARWMPWPSRVRGPQQSGPGIDIGVVPGLREQFAHPAQFVQVLAEVGLHVGPVPGRQAPGAAQQFRRGAGGGEPGGEGVLEPAAVPAVPGAAQLLALGQGGCGGLPQFRPGCCGPSSPCPARARMPQRSASWKARSVASGCTEP